MSRSSTAHREISLVRHDEGYFALHYQALGGPCEVLFDHDDPAAVRLAASQAAAETWRIEEKFSRYRKDSVVGRINAAQGSEIRLDDESCALIDYAHACHALSDGRFDITSGGLRRVWRFDGKGKLPSPRAVAACLPLIGWDKLRWRRPSLWLPKGMEIDLGGIGKEYAVDRVAQGLQAAGMAHALINFGGDLRVTGPRRDGRPWMIGIDDPRATGVGIVSAQSIAHGALATSGDARRFIVARGRRYGHILDPRTGWPVPDAPRSVSVQATTCLEAGMMATFGILNGADAEAYLQSQGVVHYVVR